MGEVRTALRGAPDAPPGPPTSGGGAKRLPLHLWGGLGWGGFGPALRARQRLHRSEGQTDGQSGFSPDSVSPLPQFVQPDHTGPRLAADASRSGSARLAQTVEPGQRAVEVFVVGVSAGGDHGAQTGAVRRAQAVGRVFERQALLRGQRHAFEHPGVDAGIGFFARHGVARAHHFKPVHAACTQGGVNQRFDIVGRGGGGDGQAQPGAARLLQQPTHARTQGDAALRHQSHIVRGLAAVELGDQPRRLGRSRGLRIDLLPISQHALFAAGNGEQTAVGRHVPMPIQPGIGEGLVESDAVTVALGFGQGAIDVENQCAQGR